jgi:hypothetical protein
VSAPTVQRWRARPEDVQDPERLLRLLNDFQQQSANAFGLLPARVERTFDYTPPQRWLTATLENSWVAYNAADAVGGYAVPQFWKDERGFVNLRGAAKSGTYGASAIFTLPVGYRPARKVSMSPVQSSVFTPAGQVDVAESGVVTAPTITSVQSGTSDLLVFDNMQFEAADPSPQPLPAPVTLTNLGLGVLPRGLRVLEARDLTGNRGGVMPALAWAPLGQDAVQITQVFGLVPGHKYSLRVEIIG